jgi:hypothetical protein
MRFLGRAFCQLKHQAICQHMYKMSDLTKLRAPICLSLIFNSTLQETDCSKGFLVLTANYYLRGDVTNG